MTQHGNIYITNGIRCDSKYKLGRVIDHLFSNIHKCVVDLQKKKSM